MDTIKCKALKAFTEFVAGYGQVHGDPNNSDDGARYPAVPLLVVARLAEEGKIENPNAMETDAPGLKTSPGDGIRKVPIPGKIGGTFSASLDAPEDGFHMEHLGFGKYRITGPGIAEETIIKGKADAETFIERLKVAVDAKPEGEGGADDTSDAPTD